MAGQDKTSEKGGKPQPSGPTGQNPSTAGKDETRVRSFTPENREGSIDPSSANDGITAPSTQATRDDAKENTNDPE